MAWCFEDDRSKFNVDAALLSTKKEAVAEARDLPTITFNNVSSFRAWARELGKGVYNAICFNTTATMIGLPWSATTLFTVYNDGSNITYINAKCVSSNATYYELVYDMFFNGSTWTNWRRDFDDILSGDVVRLANDDSWAGKGLSAREFRVTIPFGKKIRATNVTVRGSVRVACQGTLGVFPLQYRPTPGVEDMYYNTVTSIISKETNAIILKVTFDMNTNLVRADHLMLLQNDTAVTANSRLNFTFS